MKKISFLILLLLGSFVIDAQSILLDKPFSNMWANRYSFGCIPLGQNADSKVMFLYSRAVSSFSSKTYTDQIYLLNNDMQEKSVINVTASNRHDMLNAIVTDDKIIALYHTKDKSWKKLSYSIAIIDKDAEEYTVTDDRTVMVTEHAMCIPKYQSVKSPDGKMLASIVVITDKNNMLKEIEAVVINDQGEFVWHGPIVPNFSGKYFSLGDMMVDNEGNVYMPAYTCNKNKDKVMDVQFLMIKTNGDGTNTYYADAAFGKPQNFTGKVLANGDIMVAGYFTDTYKDIMTQSNGYFFYRFDTGTDNFTEGLSYDFSSNYAQKKAPALLSNVLANQQYSVRADGIYELENGDIVLCGEHRFAKEFYNIFDGSSSYQLLTKNILVSTLKSDGTSIFSMIQKQQASNYGSNPEDWRLMCISYTAFANHNDMYFVFNDAPNNIPYPGKNDVCEMSSMFTNKTAQCVLMKLSPEQEISQRVLPDGDKVMRVVEFSDEDAFYVSSISKDGVHLNKFPINQ